MTFRGPLIQAPPRFPVGKGSDAPPNLLETTLRGQDRFFGLAGGLNWDWPNPTLARDRSFAALMPAALANLVLTTLAPVVIDPLIDHKYMTITIGRMMR